MDIRKKYMEFSVFMTHLNAVLELERHSTDINLFGKRISDLCQIAAKV